MACFLVSAAEAFVVKMAEKAAKQNELRAFADPRGFVGAVLKKTA